MSRQLCNLRIKARLTQEELAYQASVSRKTISTMETDDGCEGVSLSILNPMGWRGVATLKLACMICTLCGTKAQGD